MPVMTVGTSPALVRGHYHERVLAMQPIAYWPLWESAGTVAQCLVNAAQNGTYSSDVSAMGTGTGIGDGWSAPFFDGANDLVNVHSAALAANFNGVEGTAMIWGRMAAGAWTDGADRCAVYATDATDDQEYIYMAKQDANTYFRWRYMAGAVLETINDAAISHAGWWLIAQTWSKAADAFIAYDAGSLNGSAGTLGNWAGDIDLAVIGNNTLAPGNERFHGYLAHCAFFPRALSAAEITALAVA